MNEKEINELIDHSKRASSATDEAPFLKLIKMLEKKTIASKIASKVRNYKLDQNLQKNVPKRKPKGKPEYTQIKILFPPDLIFICGLLPLSNTGVGRPSFLAFAVP